ncbi:MAG TPA: hypothetical protein VKH35_12545 [Thermoanaerobaculia bacterium]|nr:hypothetical protein [Thermoanaerobaculia bacterium]
MVRTFVAALILSAAVCVAVDFQAHRTIARTQQEIAAKQAELKKLEDVDRQVQAAEQQKKALEQRRALIDKIKRGTQ